MIKKLIVMGMLCSISASLQAQKALNINLSSKKDTEVSPIVKEKVEEYATKINTIIQEEKKLMEDELVVLQARNLDKADFDRETGKIFTFEYRRYIQRRA
jgi:hypothetical protein